MLRQFLWKIWSFLPEKIKVPLNVWRRASFWRGANVIFVHVPKVAGTSISHSLYGRSLGHIRAKDIIRYGPRNIQEIYSFAFVRNPWDRAVSAYHFAKSGGSNIAGMTNAHLYKHDDFSDFSSFCLWLSKQNLSELDPVFRSQSDFVTNDEGEVIVDFLGKLEFLDSDLKRFNLATGLNLSVEKMNRSDRDVYQNYYSSKSLIDLIGEIYKEDVRNFGYRFDG